MRTGGSFQTREIKSLHRLTTNIEMVHHGELWFFNDKEIVLLTSGASFHQPKKELQVASAIKERVITRIFWAANFCKPLMIFQTREMSIFIDFLK